MSDVASAMDKNEGQGTERRELGMVYILHRVVKEDFIVKVNLSRLKKMIEQGKTITGKGMQK